MSVFYWILAVLGLALEFLVAYRLVHDRHYRQFPYWFAYSLVLLLTTALDLSFRFINPAVFTTQLLGQSSGRRAVELYWVDDSLRQFALFLVVISLLYGVLKEKPGQKWAIIAVILVAGGSVMFFWDEPISALFTTVIRNVSFAVVFLNLVLWAALIRSGSFDRMQMMIASGIGLQMAGEAIGQALRSSPIRHSFHGVVAIGNVILVLSHLLCLSVWLSALKAHKKATNAAASRESRGPRIPFPDAMQAIAREESASHFPPA